MLYCPKCDALFEAHEASLRTACPRCGNLVPASQAIKSARGGHLLETASGPAEVTHFPIADDSRRGGFALSGRPGTLRWTKNVAIRLVSSVCANCGYKVVRGLAACPHCGRPIKGKSAQKPSELSLVLRKMLIAATVFIGLPAAVIVFVLVVCAPKGGNAEKGAPKSVQRSSSTDAAAAPLAGSNDESPKADRAATRKGPLSGLRAIRDKLRGTEHGGSGVPTKAPLEKTSDGVGDANVPPMGLGDRKDVKPDATR